MPIEATVSLGTLCSFLLVLARMSGALVFVPFPGASSASQMARVTLAVGLTLALSARWPAVDVSSISAARLAAWAAAEAAFGIGIGVAFSIVLETFTLAAQILGLQAGYAYASTIDPNTEADSGVLLVFAQMAAALVFFATGLDREILRLFAQSLEKVPPGVYGFGPSAAQSLIHLLGNLFS